MPSTWDKQTGLTRCGSSPFDFTISKDLSTRWREQFIKTPIHVFTRIFHWLPKRMRAINQMILYTMCFRYLVWCNTNNMLCLNSWKLHIYQYGKTQTLNKCSQFWVRQKEGRFKIHYPCFCNILLISVIDPEDRITSLIPLLRESSKWSR